MNKVIESLLSPANIELSSLKLEGPAVFVLPALILFFAALVASLIWLYRDAVSRKKSGLLAMLFVLVTGYPVSFLWWFWLRPAKNPAAA
jgi:hypothetical protein